VRNFSAVQSHASDRLLRLVRRMARALSQTPFHPQWFSFANKEKAASLALALEPDSVLDVGCAESTLRSRLPGSCRYVGLDFPTTGQLYESLPSAYADAARLPVTDESFDCVTLLDVLEHLREPRAALREAARVLRANGALVINVPFLYPLHDEPHDYQRPTVHGLRYWLQDAGFVIDTIVPRGAPLETSALIVNLALSRLLERATRAFMPAIVLAIVLLPVVLLSNTLGWVLGRLTRGDDIMPFAYSVVAQRAASKA
jgi:SAM-dependent methyltransferase